MAKTFFNCNINSPGFVHGLYKLTDVTSYIYVLVYHVLEFIDLHQNIGLMAFSCSEVKKKIMTMFYIFFKEL